MDKKEYFYIETKTMVSRVKRGFTNFQEGYTALCFLAQGLEFNQNDDILNEDSYFVNCLNQYTCLFLASVKTDEKEVAENFFRNGFK